MTHLCKLRRVCVKLGQRIKMHTALLLIRGLWRSCSMRVEGEQHLNQLIGDKRRCIPCYWHQQHLFCARYLLNKKQQGLNLGFLVSPSRDGDLPAAFLDSIGVTAIRGSSNRTGARALKDVYSAISNDGLSVVNTPDGPTGPIFKFKPGALMLAQMTGCPVLPLACDAPRAWYLKSWDRFMIPKPFSTITIRIGAPVEVDRTASADDLSSIAAELEQTLISLGNSAT